MYFSMMVIILFSCAQLNVLVLCDGWRQTVWERLDRVVSRSI